VLVALQPRENVEEIMLPQLRVIACAAALIEASTEDIIETFYSSAGSRQQTALHRSSLYF
jgi:hypothetical protein